MTAPTPGALKEAGRALDALVAEKVMQVQGRTEWGASTNGGKSWLVYTGGTFETREDIEQWIRAHPTYRDKPVTLCSSVFHAPYSTDIAAAFTILDKLKENPFDTISLTYDAGEWLLRLHEDCGLDIDSYDHLAGTPALAICLAALAAVEDRP